MDRDRGRSDVSTKDSAEQARKFLEQLRVVQRENAALWESVMDDDAGPLRAEYDRLRVELATSERDRKTLRIENVNLRRRIEAAGLDPDTAPVASTKNQLKDAVNTALARLRKGDVDGARAVLEKRVA